MATHFIRLGAEDQTLVFTSIAEGERQIDEVSLYPIYQACYSLYCLLHRRGDVSADQVILVYIHCLDNILPVCVGYTIPDSLAHVDHKALFVKNMRKQTTGSEFSAITLYISDAQMVSAYGCTNTVGADQALSANHMVDVLEKAHSMGVDIPHFMKQFNITVDPESVRTV